jgi:hypothetical protein
LSFVSGGREILLFLLNRDGLLHGTMVPLFFKDNS